MRTFTLILAWLLCNGLFPLPQGWHWRLVRQCWASTGGQAASGTPANPPPLTTWPRQVQGYGLTPESARRDAQEQGRLELLKYLRQKGLQTINPTVDFVDHYLVVDAGHEGEKVSLDTPPFPPLPRGGPGGVAFSWILTLKSPNLAELQRLDQQARQQQARQQQQVRREARLAGLSKVVVGLLLVLAILAGGLHRYKKLSE